MLLAVLEARAGVSFAGRDVYLNIAGGLKINEPGADLAAAAALLSSLSGVAIPRHQVHFGEVSLSGAVRATPLMSQRLKEAQKLGFRRAVMPAQGELETKTSKLQLRRVAHLRELADGSPSCD
jgi:DNA repair protein RadA/Sms